jgi:hypothetical protein
VNLAFAEKQDDDRFTIVKCPELFEGRRKVYAFEVPDISRSYSLARLVSNVRGFLHENIRRICHPILIDVSDVHQDINQIAGERLELLFSPDEAILGHLKVLDLLVNQSHRFAQDERIKLHNRVSFGQGPVIAAIDLLLNPMIIADPERFDWQMLKLKTSNVIRARSTTCALHDCWYLFQQEDIVSRRCEDCDHSEAAWISFEFCFLPKYLVIQLARFSNECRKVTTKVDYPEDLSLRESSTDEDVKYRLYAVCRHAGGILGGHYDACVFSSEQEKWVLCDGQMMSSMKSNKVQSDLAYLLFYEQIAADPSEGSNLDFE